MNNLAPILLGYGPTNALSNPQINYTGPNNGAFLSLYRQQMLGNSLFGSGAGFGSSMSAPGMLGGFSPAAYGTMLPPVAPIPAVSTSYLSLQSSVFSRMSTNFGSNSIGDILRALNPELGNTEAGSPASLPVPATTDPTATDNSTTATSPLLAALRSESASRPQDIAYKFARRIDHLAKQGVTDVALTVDNPQYGPVGIDLKIDAKGAVDLRLQTENPQLANWLTGLQSGLQKALEQNGLSLHNLSVDKTAPPESIANNQALSTNPSDSNSRAPFNLIDYYLAQAMNQQALSFVSG